MVLLIYHIYFNITNIIYHLASQNTNYIHFDNNYGYEMQNLKHTMVKYAYFLVIPC